MPAGGVGSLNRRDISVSESNNYAKAATASRCGQRSEIFQCQMILGPGKMPFNAKSAKGLLLARLQCSNDPHVAFSCLQIAVFLKLHHGWIKNE